MLVRSLKGDYAFRRLRKGRAGYAKELSVKWLAHNEGSILVGIIVNKKVGKAVTRNLVRRRLREALRSLLKRQALNTKASHAGQASFRLIIIARPEAANASYQQLERALKLALGRAGLFA